MTAEKPGLSPEFWRVYNYVAKNWYETEYGAVAFPKRWYHPTMLRLEDMAYECRKASGDTQNRPLGCAFRRSR